MPGILQASETVGVTLVLLREGMWVAMGQAAAALSKQGCYHEPRTHEQAFA